MSGATGLAGLAAEAALPWLLAAALAMARPMGIALVLPVFTRAQLGGPIAAGFALALALPALGPTLDALRAAEAAGAPLAASGAVGLAILGAKEVFAGVLLGLLFGLPVWAAQSAGEILDTQRNAGVGEASEPGAGSPSSTTAGLLGLASVAAFVAAGGLGLVAEALYASYGVWPLAEPFPGFAPGAPAALLGVLDAALRGALALAAPVLLALLVAEIAVLLVARAVPRLNVFDLAATAKNLVFLLVLLFFLAFLADALAALVGSGARGAGGAFRALLAEPSP